VLRYGRDVEMNINWTNQKINILSNRITASTEKARLGNRGKKEIKKK